MRPVDAFVAEVVADLVHALEAAHDQALEVQLVGNAQVERHVERVVVRDEGTRGRATIQRLQHGRFHLQIPEAIEVRSDGAGEHRTRTEQGAHLGVHGEVGVALTCPLFGVTERGITHELTVDNLLLAQRQRTKGLGQQLHVRDLHGGLAGTRAHHGPAHPHPVAKIVLAELCEEGLADVVLAEVELHTAVHIGEMCKGGLPLTAPRHEASGHRHLGPLFRGPQRRDGVGCGVGAIEGIAERFHSGGAQAIELLATRLHHEIELLPRRRALLRLCRRLPVLRIGTHDTPPCALLSLSALRYAWINGSMSPSMTFWTSAILSSVRWSLTIV